MTDYLSADEFYDDETTSGPIPCACGSTETVELCRDDQCVTVCAECGSDEP